MLNQLTYSSKFFRLLLLSLGVLVASSLIGAYNAGVVIGEKSITFNVSDSQVKTAVVTIVDAKGELIFKEKSQKSIVWTLPSNAADGRYKYEFMLSNIVANSQQRSDTDDTRVNTQADVVKQSGSILVQGGRIVLPGTEEAANADLNVFQRVAISTLKALIPTAKADVVHLDDVIVGGSECIGSDCVDGENFNFDTLRLKENNLRIHFDDTSSSASFPSNDWRIVINDSNNGGGNFFSVEDSTAGQAVFTVEAGATANALYVDQLGRVGFATSNPLATLHAAAGNTPTLRLHQDGSAGFTDYAWEMGANEQALFIKDVNTDRLPVQIAAGAPTNALKINATGHVGIGISAPTEKLHVVGNAIISGNLELGSSRHIKHAIEDLNADQAISALHGLHPVKYRYNHSPEQQTLGFIAEDVPELVATQSRKSLRPMDIVAVLTKVVQQQQQTIDALSEKVDKLSKNNQ